MFTNVTFPFRRLQLVHGRLLMNICSLTLKGELEKWWLTIKMLSCSMLPWRHSISIHWLKRSHYFRDGNKQICQAFLPTADGKWVALLVMCGLVWCVWAVCVAFLCLLVCAGVLIRQERIKHRSWAGFIVLVYSDGCFILPSLTLFTLWHLSSLYLKLMRFLCSFVG